MDRLKKEQSGKKRKGEQRIPSAAELTVRQGMLIQAELGTLCAFEYLRPRGISAEVIRRVLDGKQVRSEDAVALLRVG